MVHAVAGGAGNLKRANRGLDYNPYHSIHGHAGLIGQKESLTCFVGGDQGDAVSQEGRQFGESANISGLEKIILIGDQLVFPEGGGLPSPTQRKGRDPRILVAQGRSPGYSQISRGLRGEGKKKAGPKFSKRERLFGSSVGIPPFSAEGYGRAAHGQNVIIGKVESIVKPGNSDTPRLNRVDDRISNHRRISLIGRLIA